MTGEGAKEPNKTTSKNSGPLPVPSIYDYKYRTYIVICKCIAGISFVQVSINSDGLSIFLYWLMHLLLLPTAYLTSSDKSCILILLFMRIAKVREA